MKILFLDIDGVLNSRQFFLKVAGQNLLPDDKIDPDMVARLNQITDATGAHIVVSSTWRYAYQNNLSGLQSMLKRHGVTGLVIGMTNTDNHARGLQIKQWLDWHANADAFVILDDDSDDQMLHLVKTTFDLGLQDNHVADAIKILNK